MWRRKEQFNTTYMSFMVIFIMFVRNFKFKRMKKVIYTIAFTALLTSCMTTRTPVGNYVETEGKEYTYAKGKQFWVLWGIFPIGRTQVNTPSDGNCQVVTKYKFSDILISGLTGGIVTSYSIKVEVKKLPEKK
jgi:hypothetical protein